MRFLLTILLMFLLSAQCTELSNKTGQMIITGFRGNTIHSKGFKKVLKQIKKGEISGVIFFSNNIKSKDDLIKMTEKLKKANKIPPFIAVDNEGGEVQRYNYIEQKSAKEISKLSYEKARQEFAKMAQEEHELGFNLNFAPCVDLDINPNSIISKKRRSYSSDYKKVSKYAEIFIEEHNKRKIITSIKHFPGHGSIDKDTHKEFASSTETFIKDEIMPYYHLKNKDEMNTVMVSHIYNKNFDNVYPASLSQKTVEGFLINSIGFKGVIVSDDYDMKAIRDNYDLRDIVVNSINSGVNILLFSNHMMYEDKNLTNKIHRIIKEEIKNKNIDESKIDKSYQKIIDLKNHLI